MASKESKVDEVTGSCTSENVDESKKIEASLDASTTEEHSMRQEPAQDLASAEKLSDLALANVLNRAKSSLKSDVKVGRRMAFVDLTKALDIIENVKIPENEVSESSEQKRDRVIKKTELLKYLVALTEVGVTDAASVAAKYIIEYDLSLREQNSLLSNMATEKDTAGKGETQTKVQFVPGLKDHEDTLDLTGDSKKTAKCEKYIFSEPGKSSGSSGSEPASGSSDTAQPLSGTSDAPQPVSGTSDAPQPVSGISDAGDGETVTNPSDTGELLTVTSGIGEQSSEVSEIEPSSEASEIEPSSESSETGALLGSSDFERQTSANTETSESLDFATTPGLSSAQESSALDSEGLEFGSDVSRAEPADTSAPAPSAKQESSQTQTISSSTKKKQTDLEGFIFLHLSIEYIALLERERNNDIDAVLAALFKVEDELKKKIDKQVLRTFKVLLDDIGEGVLKFKNVGNVQSASSYFSESTFSESFLPNHVWSLAGTSASSIQTDSPPPDSQPGESGRNSELQSSNENSARQSRQSSVSESLGLAHDLSRLRSDSLDRSQHPPEKRIRANTPKEGYPFKDGEKSFEFQGTPLSLDGKSSQETSAPQEERETELEKSKSDDKEEKSSGYHEDASKQS